MSPFGQVEPKLVYKVVIVTEKKKPVAGVPVFLSDPATNQSFGLAKTDAAGVAEISIAAGPTIAKFKTVRITPVLTGKTFEPAFWDVPVPPGIEQVSVFILKGKAPKIDPEGITKGSLITMGIAGFLGAGLFLSETSKLRRPILMSSVAVIGLAVLGIIGN